VGSIVRAVAAAAPIALPTSGEPRVSILIVARGASSFLEGCFQRLAATAVREIPFETVVVLTEAGSEDVERVRARVWGVEVEASEVQLGVAAGLNRARARARGEFLVTLHDDTEVSPGWLEALVAAAERDPGVGAVGSLVLDPDGTMQAAGWEVLPDGVTKSPWWPGEPPAVASVQARGPHPVDYSPTCALLVRAASWDGAGGADERLYPAYYVDVDLCLAIRARGERVLCEPRSVVRHHRGATRRPDWTQFVADRNRAVMLEKWGERITAHEPGSGATGDGRDVPVAVRESDPADQERAQLRRAVELHNAYAARR
jgi:O-antigen biosynthesis protein